MPPRGKAPGLKRGRHRLPYWIASQITRDVMGYPDKCIPLPPDADDAKLAELCHFHTARLLAWIERQAATDPQEVRTVTQYDGTVLSACRVYQEHPRSPFHKVKANTRKSYLDSLKIIERDVGARAIRRLNVFDVQNWYEQWRLPALEDGPERVDRAHNAVAMFRTVLWFNAALRRPECKLLAEELKAVKFERGGAREQEMTYLHAAAFIRTAIELGNKGALELDRARCMAIGVATQFELMLRQKDVIGEWQPLNANLKLPSGKQALKLGDEVWSGYFTWEMIAGWRWRMKTSKSKYRHAADFDLTNYPLLLPLLEAVPHAERTGAVIKGEGGLPVRYRTYQKWFRRIARVAGIPDEVWSMDARAGGATEAEEAGAALEQIQASMTHTQQDTTLRYIKRRSKKIADVAGLRAAKRAADEEGN
jgi:hypothetical protein